MGVPDYRAEINEIRMLGGIGSILVLLIMVPYAGVVIAAVGIVLVLIALKRLSDISKDTSIFRNALISAIMGILAVVAISLLALGAFFVAIYSTTYTQEQPIPMGSPPGYDPRSGFSGLVASLVAALAIAWVFLIISSYFLYRSYRSVALYTGSGLFSTVGILYIIGSVLSIVAIGLLIVLVAVIIQAVAFFTLPDTIKRGEGPGASGSPQTLQPGSQ